MLYFDYAATTPLDGEVLEKMLPLLKENFGNPDSLHAYGRAAMRAVDEARDLFASLIGAKPEEIYFTSGGTEADNWAILCGARAQAKAGKPRVLISAIEHHAALSAAERLEKEGFPVAYLPVNEWGRVEVSALKEALSPDVGLVAVMAANNETGAVQPFRECAHLARENGSLFFTDAVQAAPYMPVDASDWGADMIAFSAHKFFGPKGAGALYIRRGVQIPPLIAGGEQERGLRGGTRNVAAIAGLSAAYRKAAKEREENNAHIRAVSAAFLSELAARCPQAKRNGAGELLPGIVNLTFPDVDNAAFLTAMDLHGAAVSAGAACAASSVRPSHVLLAMGLSEREAGSSVRFSFGRDNTVEEGIAGARLAAEVYEKIRG